MGTGRKSSVELPDDLWDAWKASGASIPALIREALETRGKLPDPDDRMRSLVREAVAAELDARGLAPAVTTAAARPNRAAPWPPR